jgi:hypothetical protein
MRLKMHDSDDSIFDDSGCGKILAYSILIIIMILGIIILIPFILSIISWLINSAIPDYIHSIKESFNSIFY